MENLGDYEDVTDSEIKKERKRRECITKARIHSGCVIQHIQSVNSGKLVSEVKGGNKVR
jgi:hypothetical protein